MTEEHKKRPYIPVLIVLALITAIEITLGIVLDSGSDGTVNSLKLTILLFIATIKASIIIAFYMHVKYEKKPWLLIAIVFGLPLVIVLPVALLPAFT